MKKVARCSVTWGCLSDSRGHHGSSRTGSTAQGKVGRQASQSVPDLRPSARLHAQVQHVSPLLPVARPQGRDPGRHQVELVRELCKMTDPIADFLTRLRNAIMARKTSIDVPTSKMKRKLAEILRDEGYLTAVTESGTGHPQGILSVTLRWDPNHRPAISGLRRVSK